MSEHCSPKAERAVAGAIALWGTDKAVDHVLDQVAPEDFTDRTARAVIWAAGELRGTGISCSVLTITEHLRSAGRLAEAGGEHAVDAITADAAAVGTIKQLTADVAGLARWRRRQRAARQLTEAAYTANDEEWAAAETTLDTVDRPKTGGGHTAGAALTDRLIAALNGGDPTRWPWPIDRMNNMTGGGARRGQMTFIGGPSSHGKSAFVDCCMQSMCAAGAKGVLYLNEMTADERAERIAANLTSIPYSRLQSASSGQIKLMDKEWTRIMDRMPGQPVDMVECPDWTVEQILRDARRHRPDVLALDIVQKLPTRPFDRRLPMLEDAVQRFDAFAKDTGCHVLLVGQVNRARADGIFPLPGLADVKDCAELVNGPDNVLFVWRQQDKKTLEMRADGVIRLAKYRGARLGSIDAWFDGERQRWLQAEHQIEGVAA